MASGGEADCGPIRKEKSKNGSLWSEGRRIRRKMNGVGKRSGLRMDPQRKVKGGGGWGGEKPQGCENQKSSRR